MHGFISTFKNRVKSQVYYVNILNDSHRNAQLYIGFAKAEVKKKTKITPMKTTQIIAELGYGLLHVTIACSYDLILGILWSLLGQNIIYFL